MPRSTRFTPEERAKAEALRHAGKNYSEIAHYLNRSVNAVRQFFLRGCSEGSFSSGRPRSLLNRDENRIRRLVSNSLMSAVEVRSEIGGHVSTSTVLRSIRRNKNIIREKMKLAPRLLGRHKEACIEFARKNIGRDWNEVIYSDEKKFDEPEGFSHYWRDLRKDPKIFSRRNFGGGSLMIFAAFCNLGTLELAFVSCPMDSKAYQTVLEKHLIPFLNVYPGRNLTYQQDNVAIHVSKSTVDWFRIKKIDLLEWPACSSDLNPMENMWSIVVRDVYKNAKQYTSTQELKKAILEAWNRIPQRTLQNLVDSMPRRLLDVVAAKRGATQY